MKRQIKITLLNYLKLGVLSCIALSAYANNIPENLSNWQPGASTKNGDSNATFSMAVLTDEGENNGSPFKPEQLLNVVGDIRIAPEHVSKNGVVYIVAQYNRQWFMKGSNGWKSWDLQTKNLVAHSVSHPLLEVESPVIENGLSRLLGDFEIFIGYQVDDDLNYSKTPLKFSVKIPETNGLPGPTNVTASDGGLGTAKLNVTWDAVTGADSYKVDVYDDVNETNLIATKQNITSLNTQVMGLINGLQYYVRVTAVINNSESDPSAQAMTTLSVLGMNDTATDAFDLTKLDASGSALSDQTVVWNKLGNEEANSQWSCVKDNKTGLVWEVKTDVGGADKVNNIHYKDNTYTWGGITAIGKDATTLSGIYTDDWNALVSGSNADALCGFDSGWRVPTKSELASIANLKVLGNVAITTGYFPNTGAGAYWSSSPSVWSTGTANNAVGNGSMAWRVNFDVDGNESTADRTALYRVRLVH